MEKFVISSKFKPSGDQPQAIQKLADGIFDGLKSQVLLGVTGSGKTFTMANVIEKVQRPTLVIAHNKTLAAQLCNEFREFFPNNRVEFFVSYYDYYQPEAYIVSSDTYIEKDMSINDEIDKLRNSATASLSERNDVIVVASVSCIYGLGNPEEYLKLSDTNFDILMKLAVNKCMEDEIALFDSLDTSDTAVSQKTRRKVMNTLRQQKLQNSAWMQIVKRTAVACLVIITIAFTSAMCIQPIRAGLWNAILTWYEECIGITFEKEEDAEYPTIIEERIVPETLPDGWTIEQLDGSKFGYDYMLTGPSGEIVLYMQGLVDGQEVWFDNTDCEISTILLHDQTEAYWIHYADGSNTITWKGQYIFTLAGLDVSKEILVEIAEAIK